LSGINFVCSGNGAYVSICGSGCVHTSSDYGASYIYSYHDSVTFATAISATGKYHCSVSTGVPKSYIRMLSD
jgi:hypothetical protein